MKINPNAPNSTLTKREYMATEIVNGLLAFYSDEARPVDNLVAKEAVAMADALIEELNRNEIKDKPSSSNPAVILAYAIRIKSDTISQVIMTDHYDAFIDGTYEENLQKANERLEQLHLIHEEALYSWNICQVIKSSDY